MSRVGWRVDLIRLAALMYFPIKVITVELDVVEEAVVETVVEDGEYLVILLIHNLIYHTII